MSANKTGLWVVDQRPMRVEQMMNRELENLQDNKLMRVAIIGSRVIGKTLFAHALAGFQGPVLKVSELENTPIQHTKAIILKGIDQQPNAEILRIAERAEKTILIAQEDISERTGESNSFHALNLGELMPKNQKSFEKIKNYLLGVLDQNQIQFQIGDLQFQLNIEELFDKLWPNMRQIVRQTQMRAKTGEWVSIPV